VSKKFTIYFGNELLWLKKFTAIVETRSTIAIFNATHDIWLLWPHFSFFAEALPRRK